LDLELGIEDPPLYLEIGIGKGVIEEISITRKKDFRNKRQSFN